MQFYETLLGSPTMEVGTMPGVAMTEQERQSWSQDYDWKKSVRSSTNVLQVLTITLAIMMLVMMYLDYRRDLLTFKHRELEGQRYDRLMKGLDRCKP